MKLSPPMATYLARPGPRCSGYLGIVLREPGRNTPVRAVNGHCLKCGYRLAWIVIKGKQAARQQVTKEAICWTRKRFSNVKHC
jgi:hypothetical protein